MSSSVIGALRVTLGLDSAEFSRGTKKAQVQMTGFQKSMNSLTNSAKSLGKGLVAGFAFAGVSALASDAFQMASALQEAASATGVTVEQLQRLRLAAAQNGGSADQMDAGLSKLSATLGAAQNGSKQAVATFTALGISVEQLKGLNAGEAFRLIAEKIAAIKDPTLQAAAAKQVFGKAYADFLPLLKAGTAALDEATAASKRNGEISTEDAKKLDDLADSWDMMKTRIGVGVANLIADTARGVEAFDKFFKPINQWAKEFDANFVRMASNAVASMQRLYVGVKTWISDKLGVIWDSVTAKVEGVRKMFFGLYDAVVGHSYIPDMVDGIQTEMSRLDKVMVDPAQKATMKTADAHREMAADIKQTLAGLFPELEALAQYNAEIANITKSNLDDTGKLAAKRRAFSKYQSQFEPNDSPVQTVIPDNEDDLFANAEGQIGDYLNTWQDGVNRAKRMNSEFRDSFADMARDVTGYFGNLVKSIKDGDFFSIVDSVLGLLDSVGNAVGGFNLGPLKFGSSSGGSKLPGFANGGAMKLGGMGGIDRNVLSMNGRPFLRTSRGETLQIKPQNDGGASGGIVRVMVQANDYFDARVAGQAGRVVAAAATPIASLGSNMAQRNLAQRGSRRLA